MGKDRLLDIANKERTIDLVKRFIKAFCLIILFVFVFSCSIPRIIILEDPLTPEEHINLGLSYEKKGLIEEAINEYTIASKKIPIAYLYLGNIYMQKKDFDEAERYYKRVLKKQDIADAYNNLAWLYYIKKENLNEAERLVLKALELDPGNKNYEDTLNKIREIKKNGL